MSPHSKIESDRQLLAEAQAKGTAATLGAYLRLSGPGWLQSAITLGGGTLAGSLYLGVISGYRLLWVQPLAMILGIIMLSAIAYVTTSTQQRPFGAINRHISPVLGWGWLLAAMAANMFWCLPQYSLATGVIQQNLLPDQLGPASSLGDFNSKLVIAITILVLTTAITWAYDSGSWGIKVYEWLLKAMVAGIVLCFFGVLFSVWNEVDWSAIFAGFIPSYDSVNSPSPEFAAAIAQTAHVEFWTQRVVSAQQDNLVAAAATAVGINMTFLFPYSMLAKGWNKSFRGLAVFDLATGMLIPFFLATSCVVIAAASQFHYQEARPVTAEELKGKTRADYYRNLTDLAKTGEHAEVVKDFNERIKQTRDPDEIALLNTQLHPLLDATPEADRRVAAMLASRDAHDLSKSLEPFAGARVANYVFGLGVLGMALSTITILMLISGFCVCEALGIESKGWPHRFGTLAAATGVLGPFVWSQAAFLLAVYVSAFGLMLIPIAYWSFFFMMNKRSLMGAEMPTGVRRLVWNLLMLITAGIASVASVLTVYKQLKWPGIGVLVAFVVLALIVGAVRKPQNDS